MNDKQKTSVTAQNQLHCQLDRHQMLTYTAQSTSKHARSRPGIIRSLL